MIYQIGESILKTAKALSQFKHQSSVVILDSLGLETATITHWICVPILGTHSILLLSSILWPAMPLKFRPLPF